MLELLMWMQKEAVNSWTLKNACESGENDIIPTLFIHYFYTTFLH